jgi:hypothetical protein
MMIMTCWILWIPVALLGVVTFKVATGAAGCAVTRATAWLVCLLLSVTVSVPV